MNNDSCSAFSNDTDSYCSESDSTKAESEFTLSDDESTFSTESENRDNDINLQFKGFKEGLSLYYTNADNLLFKLDKLKVRIQLVSPDILIITEIYPKTEKSSDIKDEEILIDNYTLYRSNVMENSRGVAIYVKETLSSTINVELTDHLFSESVWVNYLRFE